MESGHPLQVILRDPLSEVTRKERRMLLSFSVVGVFVARAGLVPAKISALGIDFERTQQQTLLLLFALVVCYFVAAFVIYGFTDFLAWRIAYHEGSKVTTRELLEGIGSGTLQELRQSDRVAEKWIPRWPRYAALPASVIRALFDFLLPIIVGAYAIYSLLTSIK